MNDQSVVRLVISILGIVALVVVAGSIALTFDDRVIPDSLIAIGSLAVGAVAGILSRTGTDAPQPVEVVNRVNDPVPVAEAGHAAGDTLVTVAVVIIAVVAVLFAAGIVPN